MLRVPNIRRAQREDWQQLIRFCVVGASGYFVNLAVFSALVHGAGAHYALAAVVAFCVAWTNNFLLNKFWTFRRHGLSAVQQGARYLAVSLVALGLNLLLLELLVRPGARRSPPRPSRSRRSCPSISCSTAAGPSGSRVATGAPSSRLLAALASPAAPPAAAAPAHAVQDPTPSRGDRRGRTASCARWATRPPRSSGRSASRRRTPSRSSATTRSRPSPAPRAAPRLDRLPRAVADGGRSSTPRRASTPSTRQRGRRPARRPSRPRCLVSDDTGQITEVRTGPQVAWMMARGYDGAFGRALTRPVIWIPLCVLFLRRAAAVHAAAQADLLAHARPARAAVVQHLADLVRPRRDLHLGAAPVPADGLPGGPPGLDGDRAGPRRPAPPAAAGGRRRGRRPGAAAPPARRRPAFGGWAPTWLLVTLLVVTLALRFGLNAFDSNVIDVGYAGVIGADRITHGETPYGTMPHDCSACDTYGPLNYITYVPFELAAAVARHLGRAERRPRRRDDVRHPLPRGHVRPWAGASRGCGWAWGSRSPGRRSPSPPSPSRPTATTRSWPPR